MKPRGVAGEWVNIQVIVFLVIPDLVAPSLNQTTLCIFPREDVQADPVQTHNWSDKIAAWISHKVSKRVCCRTVRLHTISSNLIQSWMWHERNTSICQQSTSTYQLQETSRITIITSPIAFLSPFCWDILKLSIHYNHLICQGRHTDDRQVTHQ